MSRYEDASYAVDVARLLWPAPWAEPRYTRSRRPNGARDSYVFPSTRRPRLLLPTDVPAAAIMLRRLGGGTSRSHDAARWLFEKAVGSRAFAAVPWPVLRSATEDHGAESVEQHLSTAFDTEVRAGIVLGTRRVNQKPVLQVFDRAGKLLGYAKIGHNELTTALVRREAASLARLSALSPRSLQVPRLVGHATWSGLEVLCMSALESDPRRPVSGTDRRLASREVTALLGTTDSTLADSTFWKRIAVETHRLRAEPLGARLVAAAGAVSSAHSADHVRTGGWHGDWGHWNMAMGRTGTLQVWDWERYDTDVPAGFDELHHAAQAVRPHTMEAGQQEALFLGQVGRILADQDVPFDRHALTLRLYLLEISSRYVEALTHGATRPLRHRAEWTLSLLERHLSARPTLVGGTS